MPGYQSLSTKVSVLISANLNAIVNRALALNDVAVFDEYLNRMHAELVALQYAEGFERGRVRTLTRQIAGIETTSARYDQEIDRLLLRGERSLAAGRQAALNTKRDLATDLRSGLAEAEAEIERLSRERASLTAQIDLTEAKRLELRSLIQRRSAAEARARRTAGVGGYAGSGSHALEIVERVRQEAEIALGRAEVTAIAWTASIEDLLADEDIEQQLREREERLQRPSAGPASRDDDAAEP